MKSAYYLITIPIIFIGRFLLAFNAFQLKNKLDKCIQVVDQKSVEIPEFYTEYLVSAEDHRSRFHCGIDQIGMLRAIYKRFFDNEIQGASTIEQQVVRVVTGDYSHCLQRKLKEQLLAVFLAKKKGKIDIAKAYLAIAYYGHNCEGIMGISKLVGSDLRLASEAQVISIMARLKYPKPSTNLAVWGGKVSQRESYIKNRHQKAANKSRKRILRTALETLCAQVTRQ